MHPIQSMQILIANLNSARNYKISTFIFFTLAGKYSNLTTFNSGDEKLIHLNKTISLTIHSLLAYANVRLQIGKIISLH